MATCCQCSRHLGVDRGRSGRIRAVNNPNLPMEESYVFLPPRFGEASIMAMPSNFTLMESYMAPDGPGITGRRMNMGESMVAITHSDASKTVELATALATHSSGKPLLGATCTECMKRMTDLVASEINHTREEKRCLMTLLSSLDKDVNKGMLSKQSVATLAEYEAEMKALDDSLQLMVSESKAIHAEMDEMRQQCIELERMEEELWKQIGDYQYDLETFKEERDSAIAAIGNTYRRIDEVRYNNIYNGAFYIWHDGPFGTINGFRMGRLPAQQVGWNEINAAWGEAAFLLKTLADSLNLVFANYKIVPLGTFSKVKRLRGPELMYELNGSDNDNFPESRFNLGMTAWLECLQQLGDHAEQQDASIRLPYKINGECIAGVPIVFVKSEEKWTKALKFALTNLKWILAWYFKRHKRVAE